MTSGSRACAQQQIFFFDVATIIPSRHRSKSGRGEIEPCSLLPAPASRVADALLDIGEVAHLLWAADRAKDVAIC